MGLLEGSSGKNGTLTVVVASLFLVSLGVFSHDAFAHGAAPSTCPNRYDGNIISFIIDNGTQTFDAIAHPGVTFDEKYGSDYGVTFVIHTLNASSQNNTNPGTTWYDTNRPGYGWGVCVSGAGPDQNVTIATHWGHAGTAGPGGTYPVWVDTYTGHGVTFNVHWYAVPYAPTNLSARGLEPSQINLSWDAPTYGGTAPLTNYTIYRSDSSGNEALLATVGDVTSYNDTTVTYGTTYYYKVAAENSYGQSPQSNEASASPPSPSAAPPQPPVNLAATPISSYQVNLSWQAPINDGGAGIIGYKIERSDNGGSTWNVLVPNTGGGSNTGGTATAYSDTGLQPTTTHLYRISSINYAGTSPPSSAASATTLPALVAEWKFDGDTNDASSYDNNGANNGAAFVSGKVGQALSFDGTDDIVTVANSQSLNFGTVSFSISTWVRATGTASGWIINHASNNDGVYAGYQISDGAGTVSASIEQDTGHRASVAGTTSINDGAFHHIALVVDRSAQTMNLYVDDNLQGSANIANVGNIDTSLDLGIGGVISPNTADFFNGTVDQTRIYSKALSSSEVQALFGEASQSGTAIPSAPQNLVATPGNAQVSLSWSAPSGNGGSPITNYKVYRSTSSGIETLFTQIGNVTSYIDNTVASGQPYYYKVSAVNSIGESTQSNEASATPAAPSGSDYTGGIVLNNVQSTSGTTSTSNQITLSNFNARSGSNNLIVVGVGANNAAVSSVTFGEIHLTKAVSSFSNNDAEFWYMTNPSGTGNIIVTMSGPTSAVVGAYSFSGVNQIVPIPTHLAKHNTTPNSPNISITTKYPNDWVLDLPSIYGGEKLGSPVCTQQWNANVPNAITGASSSTVVSSPATVTCSWTASSADLWDDVAVEIGSYTASGASTGTTTTAPSAPTGLTATPGNAQVTLSWTSSATNGGSAITNYKVYRSTSSGTETLLTKIGNVTSYTDNTVTNGQAYFYKVTAVNSAGESALSNEASATSHTSSDEVIDTIPVGNYPSYIAVYPNTNRIYVSDGNDTKVIDGATDAVVGAIPVHPIQMAINPTTNLIYALAGSGQTVYVINGTTNAIVNTIPLNQTMGSIVVNPNTNKIYEATSYGLYVYVVDGTTNDIIKIIQLPGSIEGLAINPQTNKIYVSHYMSNVLSVIDGSTDTHVGDVGVDSRALSVGVNPLTNIIYLSTRGSGANPNTYVINGSTNSVITIIPHFVTAEFGVNPATNKIYMATGNSPNSVSVINGSTNSVIQSMTVGYDPNGIGVNPDTNRIYVSNYLASSVSVIAGSSSSGTPPATIAPSTPQSLVATAGNAQVSLSWASPKNDGGSAITGYNIYRGTSTGGESFLASVSAGTTSYADTSVANGATYYYDIAAVNSVGTSIPSNEAHATPAAPATVSSAPTGLTATTASSSQINLSWTVPANNGGSQVTGYMIQRSTDGGIIWSTIVQNTGSAAAKYNDTGLSPSTTYTYQVSAINSVGTSAPSNTSFTTTSSAQPSSIVLNNVQSTSGTTDSSNQITLSNFNATAGADRLLVVGISANSNNVGSITFAGVPLTREVSHFTNNDAEFWYLTNPTGSGDITVTMNGPTQAVVGAYSFSGVNQTVPIPAHITRHNLSPSSPAISITTNHPNDWVLDLPSIWGGVTLGSPTCTQQWDVNVLGQITGASSSTMVPSPATITCSWTASSDNMWDDAAVEVRAAG